MSSTSLRSLTLGLASLLLCSVVPTARSEERLAGWSQSATRQYLDSRTGWWLDWSHAARGRGTSCASCHTTVPYAIVLPSLAKLPGGPQVPDVARRLLAGVRNRVEKWDELATDGPKGKDVLTPIFGGARRETSLDTESVLNAVTVVINDPPGKGALSDAAKRAIDIMWSRQQADGAWRWLEFGLLPWEQDGNYFGATLAAVAVGTVDERDSRHADADTRRRTAALRGFLRARLAEKPLLHNAALGLWAGSYLPDLFTDSQKQPLIADLFKIQREDGGWSMRDLGKARGHATDRGWPIVGSHPSGAVSDGYATGLVVLALKRARVSGHDARLAKGLSWLSTHQAADGTWPVVYVNTERNPESNIGKFNRDAGAAFALMALTEPM
jgi:squalene-hopene/tetraprenyl-beta-curcumene cyclase